MSNIENNKQGTEPKKISLQEAIKQKLASKQQNQASGNASNDLVKTTKRLKSQHTKKPNNQRKRTGV